MKESYTDLTEEKKKEVKRLIESIMNMPDTDDLPTIRQLAVYLHRLLRVRVVIPPTSEVMISLQAEKPTLYHSTRLALGDRSHLDILFKIQGDRKLARERLHQFLQSL
ncbi:hypothetical protein G3578_19170 [Brevibacillus sp. SYP-B805]|uniref:hypothetical protein n=1 Tax=Brevibacillus sp. SYP-B805 TaxID=1578199 RepID=UPI0013EB97AC|nr:hypothetical protein [Brevibacillus sp. SYP-B805]NGQ97263.1 hypothetical protein [Brevibacillus sp. SYP-B805]